MNKNGEMWMDDAGNPIQAHGGMILEHEGIFYWYGEYKGADNVPGMTRVDVIGVSCYTSLDLNEWHYEGIVLPIQENPESMIKAENVLERPKVVYNKKTNKFIMYAHLDSADYVYAGIVIAISNTPTGEFKVIAEKQPNRQDSRDMTLFVDTDNTAYLIHSTNWNKTLNIARLTEDYTDLDGFYVSVLIDQEREAPAIIYDKGMYYMITSGCTGWNYNSALYAESPFLLGKWKLIDNPCEGQGYRETFKGQSTYMFKVGQQIYLMIDHWTPNDLKNSGYSILPVIIEKGILTIQWTETLSG